MTSEISSEQIKVIHTLKSRARMSDGDYRAMLAARNVESSKQLSRAAAIGLIHDLRAIAPADRRQRDRQQPGRMAGPYAPKLRALWLSGWNLGVVRQKDDRALIAFIERQTKLTHPKFLHDPAEARKAIEALKKMLTREAGVRWPNENDPVGMVMTPNGERYEALLAIKRAIVRAQQFCVLTRGGIDASLMRPPASYSMDEIDAVQVALGPHVREARTS